MVETAVNLDVPRNRGHEGLSRRNNPVENHALQALRIVGSRGGYSLLKLTRRWVKLGITGSDMG